MYFLFWTKSVYKEHASAGHGHLPLLPADTMELGIGLTPYFLDTREEEGEDLVMPSSWAVKSAVAGLFKDATKPVVKKMFTTWRAALEDVSSWEEEPALNKFPDPRSEETDEPEEEDDFIGRSLPYTFTDVVLHVEM